MDFIIKLIIMSILVISGVGKLINPIPAMQLLEKLPLFPNILILPLVSIMPILELLVAIGIIFKYKSLYTHIANLFLFGGFLIISVYATYLKINDDCGCFGSLLESKIGWTMVLRNTIFLAMAIYLLIKNNKIFFYRFNKAYEVK